MSATSRNGIHIAPSIGPLLPVDAPPAKLPPPIVIESSERVAQVVLRQPRQVSRARTMDDFDLGKKKPAPRFQYINVGGKSSDDHEVGRTKPRQDLARWIIQNELQNGFADRRMPTERARLRALKPLPERPGCWERYVPEDEHDVRPAIRDADNRLKHTYKKRDAMLDVVGKKVTAYESSGSTKVFWMTVAAKICLIISMCSFTTAALLPLIVETAPTWLPWAAIGVIIVHQLVRMKLESICQQREMLYKAMQTYREQLYLPTNSSTMQLKGLNTLQRDDRFRSERLVMGEKFPEKNDGLKVLLERTYQTHGLLDAEKQIDSFLSRSSVMPARVGMVFSYYNLDVDFRIAKAYAAAEYHRMPVVEESRWKQIGRQVHLANECLGRDDVAHYNTDIEKAFTQAYAEATPFTAITGMHLPYDRNKTFELLQKLEAESFERLRQAMERSFQLNGRLFNRDCNEYAEMLGFDVFVKERNTKLQNPTPATFVQLVKDEERRIADCDTDYMYLYHNDPTVRKLIQNHPTTRLRVAAKFLVWIGKELAIKLAKEGKIAPENMKKIRDILKAPNPPVWNGKEWEFPEINYDKMILALREELPDIPETAKYAGLIRLYGLKHEALSEPNLSAESPAIKNFETFFRDEIEKYYGELRVKNCVVKPVAPEVKLTRWEVIKSIFKDKREYKPFLDATNTRASFEILDLNQRMKQRASFEILDLNQRMKQIDRKILFNYNLRNYAFGWVTMAILCFVEAAFFHNPWVVFGINAGLLALTPIRMLLEQREKRMAKEKNLLRVQEYLHNGFRLEALPSGKPRFLKGTKDNLRYDAYLAFKQFAGHAFPRSYLREVVIKPR